MEKGIYIRNKRGRVVDVPESLGLALIRNDGATLSDQGEYYKENMSGYDVPAKRSSDFRERAEQSIQKHGIRKKKVKRIVLG